jgi:hypothetical protein
VFRDDRRGRYDDRPVRRDAPRRGEHPPADPSPVVAFFGLSSRTTEQDVQEHCERLGQVKTVTLIKDRKVRLSVLIVFDHFGMHCV